MKGLDKPKKTKSTLLQRLKDKEKRKEFCKMNIDKKIKGEDTFFTDEKIFILNTQLIGQLIK